MGKQWKTEENMEKQRKTWEYRGKHGKTGENMRKQGKPWD